MSNKVRAPKQVSPTSANKSHPSSAKKSSVKPLPVVPNRNTPKPLPPIPRNSKKSKYQLEKDWWALSGDMLAKYGKKAWDYGVQVLSGFGDYELKTNSLVAAATEGKNGNEVPIIYNGKAANIVRHREYIQDVMGSTSNFNLMKFSVNPSLDATFPWLAPLANCYTNYRVRGMLFEFVTLTADFSTTAYIGYVAMASNYNSAAADFTSKKEMENSEYSNSAKPSQSFCHPIECAKGQLSLDELYIRKENAPNQDPRFTDLCNFYIATGGQATNGIVGELWVTYEIEFYFPVLSMHSAQIINSAKFSGSGVSTITPFGSTTTFSEGTFVPNGVSGTGFDFPPECYGQDFMIDVIINGSVAGNLQMTAISSGAPNVILRNNMAGYTAGASGTRCSITYFVSVDSNNYAFRYPNTGGTYPTGTVTIQCFVVQTPRGFDKPIITPFDEFSISHDTAFPEDILMNHSYKSFVSHFQSEDEAIKELIDHYARKHAERLKSVELK